MRDESEACFVNASLTRLQTNLGKSIQLIKSLAPYCASGSRIVTVTEVRIAGWSYVLDEPVRVLVADDDPILREFASVHLSTPTATIITAADGLAATTLFVSRIAACHTPPGCRC